MSDLHHFTLETERLCIRPLTLDDLDSIHMALNSAFGEASLEKRRHWLQWTVMNYDALAGLMQPPYGERAITLKSTGELIGAVGIVPAYGPFEKLPWFQSRLNTPNSPHSTPEIGLFWGLRADQQGQGYATEAARAVIDFLFERWGLGRVVATTEYDNTASMRVMEKLGMSIERNPDDHPAWFQVIGVLGAVTGFIKA
jgi:RimJ/RimL family protein N-acetyltransferase